MDNGVVGQHLQYEKKTAVANRGGLFVIRIMSEGYSALVSQMVVASSDSNQ